VAENKPVYSFSVELRSVYTEMMAYEEHDPLSILLMAFGSLVVIFLYHIRINREETPRAVIKLVRVPNYYT
jgi:hypothetical protein